MRAAVEDGALARGDGWTSRLATPADNTALCDLFEGVTMGGSFEVAQDRRPDFFRAYGMPGGAWEVHVATDHTGGIVAAGAYSVREGYVDGRRMQVGYVGDLRFRPAFRGARVLPTMGRAALERARRLHRTELFHVAVMDANRRARRTAVHRDARRALQPVARPVSSYDMVNVQPTGSATAPADRVAPAARDDAAELARFLDDGQRRRLFGWVVTRAELERRLACWPGLAPGSFLVARDAGGGIVGCCAPWSTSSFKRSRLVSYHGALRAARPVHDALARLRGRTPLPRPGDDLRIRFLTHLEVTDDEPSVLRELVAAAAGPALSEPAHTLSVMVPHGSRLRGGLRGLAARRLPITLYTLTLPGSAWDGADLRRARPGVEMALA